MPTVDILDQPTVVEATNDVAVVAFTESNVTVEVPSPAPVVEFASSASGLIVAGTGLTGGGALIGNVSLALSAASIASLAKAETAVQPGAGVSTFPNDAGYLTAATVEGGFQPLSDDLTYISNLTTTVFGRSFLELADAAAARTLLGVYSTSQVYTQAEVAGLLATKAGVSHSHSDPDIVSVGWSKLTGIPVAFPPGAHTHVMADLTDYVATGTWGSITGVLSAQTDLQAALDAKAASSHPHVWVDITDKPTTFAPSAHSHAILDVTGLQTALDGKAASSHPHLWADITDKPLTFVPSSHTHLWAEITDPPATYTPAAHVHAAGDVTSGVFSTALLGTGTANSGTFLRGDGTWQPLPVVSHTHDYLPLAGGTVDGTLIVQRPGTPTQFLELSGSASHNTIISRVANSNAKAFVFNSTTTDDLAPTAGAIGFRFNVLGSTRLTIDGATGYVGIGTLTPDYKLEVAGDFGITGTMQAGTVPWARLSDVPAAVTNLQTELDNRVGRQLLQYRPTTDARTAEIAGIDAYYHSSAAVDLPSGVIDQSLLSLSYSADWTTQIGHDWRTNVLYTRTQNAGVWGSWVALSKVGHTHTLSDLTNKADLWNDMDGADHGYYIDFNAPTRFGPVYLQGTTNGPGVIGATQYYAWSQGLGSNYGYDLYAAQFAIPRVPVGGNPILSVRYRENGGWTGWTGIGAGLLQNGGNSISFQTDQWRITTANGYGNFGPQNTGWFHMNTDRAAFYMGNALHVNGSIYRYGTNYAMDSDGFYLDASANRMRAVQGSYGVASFYGSKNGYSGIRFDSAYHSPNLMFNTGGLIGGFYSETASWFLYYTGSQWQGPGGQALLMSNFAGSGIVSRGTAAPSGGSDGDIYLQYT